MSWVKMNVVRTIADPSLVAPPAPPPPSRVRRVGPPHEPERAVTEPVAKRRTDGPAVPVGTSVRAKLEELFRSHHEVIWRTVRRLGASSEAAADFTQQAFVIAAERFKDIRPGCERAFLFATAIGLARTSRRREARCQLSEDMEPFQRNAIQQGEQLTREHYARQLVDRILTQMDTEIATTFVLYEMEGMSSPEIAELVGVPLGTVASRLRRARQTFRAQVDALEQSTAGAHTA